MNVTKSDPPRTGAKLVMYGERRGRITDIVVCPRVSVVSAKRPQGEPKTTEKA